MKQVSRKIINLFLVCVLCSLLIFGIDVKSEVRAFYEEEERILCSATENDEFATNRVLVVLDSKESSRSLTYTYKDFKSVKCKRVKDLNRACLYNSKHFTVENHNRVLMLDLETRTKKRDS